MVVDTLDLGKLQTDNLAKLTKELAGQPLFTSRRQNSMAILLQNVRSKLKMREARVLMPRPPAQSGSGSSSQGTSTSYIPAVAVAEMPERDLFGPVEHSLDGYVDLGEVPEAPAAAAQGLHPPMDSDAKFHLNVRFVNASVGDFEAFCFFDEVFFMFPFSWIEPKVLFEASTTLVDASNEMSALASRLCDCPIAWAPEFLASVVHGGALKRHFTGRHALSFKLSVDFGKIRIKRSEFGGFWMFGIVTIQCVGLGIHHPIGDKYGCMSPSSTAVVCIVEAPSESRAALETLFDTIKIDEGMWDFWKHATDDILPKIKDLFQDKGVFADLTCLGEACIFYGGDGKMLVAFFRRALTGPTLNGANNTAHCGCVFCLWRLLFATCNKEWLLQFVPRINYRQDDLRVESSVGSQRVGLGEEDPMRNLLRASMTGVLDVAFADAQSRNTLSFSRGDLDRYQQLFDRSMSLGSDEADSFSVEETYHFQITNGKHVLKDTAQQLFRKAVTEGSAQNAAQAAKKTASVQIPPTDMLLPEPDIDKYVGDIFHAEFRGAEAIIGQALEGLVGLFESTLPTEAQAAGRGSSSSGSSRSRANSAALDRFVAFLNQSLKDSTPGMGICTFGVTAETKGASVKTATASGLRSKQLELLVTAASDGQGGTVAESILFKCLRRATGSTADRNLLMETYPEFGFFVRVWRTFVAVRVCRRGIEDDVADRGISALEGRLPLLLERLVDLAMLIIPGPHQPAGVSLNTFSLHLVAFHTFGWMRDRLFGHNLRAWNQQGVEAAIKSTYLHVTKRAFAARAPPLANARAGEPPLVDPVAPQLGDVLGMSLIGAQLPPEPEDGPGHDEPEDGHDDGRLEMDDDQLDEDADDDDDEQQEVESGGQKSSVYQALLCMIRKFINQPDKVRKLEKLQN